MLIWLGDCVIYVKAAVWQFQFMGNIVPVVSETVRDLAFTDVTRAWMTTCVSKAFN